MHKLLLSRLISRTISLLWKMRLVEIPVRKKRMRLGNGSRAFSKIKAGSIHRRRSRLSLGETGRSRNVKKQLEMMIIQKRILVRRISEWASFFITTKNTKSRFRNYLTAKLFSPRIQKLTSNSNQKSSSIKPNVYTNCLICPAKISKKESNISKSSKSYKNRIRQR